VTRQIFISSHPQDLDSEENINVSGILRYSLVVEPGGSKILIKNSLYWILVSTSSTLVAL
jgi:hypothetical protein